VVAKETYNYVKGYYGRPPASIKEEVVKLILKNEEPINTRPADLLDPVYEKCREEVIKLGYYSKEEDVLTYCLFPDVAVEFFKIRNGKSKQEKPERDIWDEVLGY